MLKIPIARLGAWEHPVYDYVWFTQKDFDEIKRNFENNEWGFEPYLRYGHARYAGAADGEPATAFLSRVEQENDVLFGIFKAVDPTVVQEIREGKYRYASAELTRNASGKKLGQGRIGTVLTAVSLTNAPFVPDLPRNQVLGNNTNDEHFFVLNMKERTVMSDQATFMQRLSQAFDGLATILSQNPFAAKGGEERHGDMEKLAMAEEKPAPLMPGLKEMCLSMRQGSEESEEAYANRIALSLQGAYGLYLSSGMSEDDFKLAMKHMCSMMEADEELKPVAQKFTASVFTDTPVYKNGVLVKGQPDQGGTGMEAPGLPEYLSMADRVAYMSNEDLMKLSNEALSSYEMMAAKEELSFRAEEESEMGCSCEDYSCGSCMQDMHESLSDGFVPPQSVRSAAKRGLELRSKFGRGGLDTREAGKQGIGSGVARARDLAAGSSMPLKTVKRMKSFFARHQKNKSGSAAEGDRGAIAWLLWGGDAGKSWADGIVAREEKKQEMSNPKAEMYAMGVGSMVRWGSSGGTAMGKIVGIVKNGNVPGIPVKITGSPEDPAARIRLYRKEDGKLKATDEYVGHKVSTLQALSQEAMVEERYTGHMSKMSDEMLSMRHMDLDLSSMSDKDCMDYCMANQYEVFMDDFEDELMDRNDEQLAQLTYRARQALDSDQFAVPEKRKLPIHDASHVRNALARFNQTKGLTPEEKESAMRRIRSAASKFGIEVSERHTASPDAPLSALYANGEQIKGADLPEMLSNDGDRGNNGSETRDYRPMPPHHPQGAVAYLVEALSQGVTADHQQVLSTDAAGVETPSASHTTHEEGNHMPEQNEALEARLAELEQKLSQTVSALEAEKAEKSVLLAEKNELAAHVAVTAQEKHELKLSQRAEAAKRDRIPPVLVDEVVNAVRTAGFEQKLSMSGSETNLSDLLFGLLEKLPEENRVNFTQVGAKQVLSQNVQVEPEGGKFVYTNLLADRFGKAE